MSNNKRAYNNTLGHMVDQFRKDKGRGETKGELRAMKEKLNPVVRKALVNIDDAKRRADEDR